MRSFHAWRKADRVVRKGQKGIKIVAPVLSDDGAKVTTIRHTHVFDMSQTDELAHRETRAAA